VQVMVDPNSRGAGLHSSPGGIEALPAYGDGASLLASARDHNMALGTFAGAIMTTAKRFAWAAGNSWAIAINVFRAPDQPVYVLLAADVVKDLARGSILVSAAAIFWVQCFFRGSCEPLNGSCSTVKATHSHSIACHSAAARSRPRRRDRFAPWPSSR
jgi:hypothetical protein